MWERTRRYTSSIKIDEPPRHRRVAGVIRGDSLSARDVSGEMWGGLLGSGFDGFVLGEREVGDPHLAVDDAQLEAVALAELGVEEQKITHN